MPLSPQSREPVRLDAKKVHDESIVIDLVSPLASTNPEYLEWYREGGATVVGPTVGSTDSARVTLDSLAKWHRLFRERTDLVLVRRADDVVAAQANEKIGIILHFQGTDPIEDNLDLVDLYKGLGVGIVQLTYNIRNRVGDGCEEPGNGGLSRFGARLVDRLNAAKVIVDCSHTGLQTSLDAIERSNSPVILSHSNVAAVHASPRNVSNQLIKAIADCGGVIGLAGFPAMVGGGLQPTLDDFSRHLDELVQQVGIEHVGLGIDYYVGQSGIANEVEARRGYEESVASGLWSSAYPPPPYHYPEGIETPRGLPFLTEFLIARGYSVADIQALLGVNWLRVFRQVWG